MDSPLKYLLSPFKIILNAWYERGGKLLSFHETVGKLSVDMLPPPVIILTVKGGIGKTLCAANIAMKLSDLKVGNIGLLDADLENPSAVRYLGITNEQCGVNPNGLLEPVIFKHKDIRLRIFSMGNYLMDNPRRAMFFDGKAIQKQMIDALYGVEWSNPDYFIIDSPPTLSDELHAIIRVFPKIGGVIIVGTSEQQAVDGAERSLNMCIQHGIPVIGLIENKSGAESDCCGADMVCGKCGKKQHLYDQGEIRKLAKRYHQTFLGTIPFNPRINRNTNDGKCFIFDTYSVFEAAAKRIIAL